MYKIAVACFLCMILTSCNSKKTRVDNIESQAKWSVRMANSVMQTSDTLLVYEARNNPNRKYNNEEWDYDIGYLGQAIAELGKIDPKYSKYRDDYINHFILDDGNILNFKMDDYNIDKINPAKNLFRMYQETGDVKYKKAMDHLADQMKSYPTTVEGGFWHKKIYPSQMWLDGIYMASPFLAQYGKEFNQPEWFDVVANQIILVYKKTIDVETGLLFHAQDESKAQKWADPVTGRSSYLWGRSMGWYVMAIVDVLDYFPKDHVQYNQILEIYRNTMEAVMKVRDPKTGAWYQILNLPERQGNYLEGSASAMFTYAIAKGAKQGYLGKEYLKIAGDCFDSLINVFIQEESNGKLIMENICGGAGLGGTPYRDGSFEYYVSEQIVPNDCKGVAPFIMAAIELNR